MNKEGILHNLSEISELAEVTKDTVSEIYKQFENNNNVLPYKNWKYIVIHHSATADGIVHDWKAIKKYHTEMLGWRDLGYNFGIEKIGNEYVYRVGRPMNYSGAHTKGLNSEALGVCCVGNFDIIEPPDEQWNMCLNLTKILQSMFDIPTQNVVGHREAYQILEQPVLKTCPGKKWNMILTRRQLGNSKFENFFSPRRKIDHS